MYRGAQAERSPAPNAGRVIGTLFSWLDRRADGRAEGTNARATRELRQALELYALPWLERTSDLAGARDELARRGPVWWAAAAAIRADELRSWGRANGVGAVNCPYDHSADLAPVFRRRGGRIDPGAEGWGLVDRGRTPASPNSAGPLLMVPHRVSIEAQ
ncbi:MAG: hypothetical protein ABI785_07615 [Gemmatimonadales bacterium]